MVKAGGVAAGDRLSFAVADLTADAGWAEAVAGCDFVLHVASPFPMSAPKHEDDLIVPARQGALRVLRAARGGGVKRVVLTSSFAAIGYGHPSTTKTFIEADWTNVDGGHVSAYAKSKTLAEKAAWGFHRPRGRRAGAFGGQSRGRVRAGPGPRPFHLHRNRSAHAGRRRAGTAQHLFRAGGRPGRGGHAPFGHDHPGGEGRAVPGGGWRKRQSAADRQDSEVSTGRGRRKRCRPEPCPIGWFD